MLPHFLLASGDLFLREVVKLLPKLENERRADTPANVPLAPGPSHRAATGSAPGTARSYRCAFHRATWCRAALSIAAALLSLVACDQAVPTSATPRELPAAIYAAWAEGQRDLEAYVGARAYASSPDDFDWREREGLFTCGDDRWPDAIEHDRAGCFWPNDSGRSLIEWSAGHPGVVRHEAGHATLFALGDRRYRCYSGGGTVHDPDCVEK